MPEPNLKINDGDRIVLFSLSKTIKKVEEEIERHSFNTVVSTLMICVNELTDQKCNSREIIFDLTILLSPYAPHISEEIWQKLGNNTSISTASFPKFNISYLAENDYIFFPSCALAYLKSDKTNIDGWFSDEFELVSIFRPRELSSQKEY